MREKNFNENDQIFMVAIVFGDSHSAKYHFDLFIASYKKKKKIRKNKNN